MALASYFSKNLLSITQALGKNAGPEFKTVLESHIVGIAYDEAVEKHEGKVALDLVIRLVCRLYPVINFIDLRGENKLTSENHQLAKSINKNIEISNGKPTIIISVSESVVPLKISKGQVFYIGSDGWISMFSPSKPVSIGKTQIPFAAGFSACVGVSNVFRYVFKNFLTDTQFDQDFSFSLLDLCKCTDANPTKVKKINIGEVALVGLGAIGNGAAWALKNADFIKGKLWVIEPEKLELSNLQRYVLSEEKGIEKPKIAMTSLNGIESSLQWEFIENDWTGFLENEKNRQVPDVLIAIDNSKDRVGIQSSLPKQIINAYTDKNLIGISRHFNFIHEACVVCTYMPNEVKKSFAFEACQNLGISPTPEMERLMGGYLYTNAGADDRLLKWIAEANLIEITNLLPFKGLPVREFYSKFVCGGLILEMKKNGEAVSQIEAPLAFQSAMAGILLVAELVIHKGKLRKKNLPNITHIYPLFPLEEHINPYHHTFIKDNSGRCICTDFDFTNAFIEKWQ